MRCDPLVIARVADSLVFTLATGKELYVEVDDGKVALNDFRLGHKPNHGDWIQIGDEQLVRRGAIVWARITGGDVPQMLAL